MKIVSMKSYEKGSFKHLQGRKEGPHKPSADASLEGVQLGGDGGEW